MRSEHELPTLRPREPLAPGAGQTVPGAVSALGADSAAFWEGRSHTLVMKMPLAWIACPDPESSTILQPRQLISPEMGDRKGSSESQRVSWNLPGGGVLSRNNGLPWQSPGGRWLPGTPPGPPKRLHAWNHQYPASLDSLLPEMENHLCAQPELLTGPRKRGLDLSFLEEAASGGFPGEPWVLAMTVDLSQPLSTEARSLHYLRVCVPNPFRLTRLKPSQNTECVLGIALLLGARSRAPGGDA